jgi:Ca2+-binding EF-hand superfamily protein
MFGVQFFCSNVNLPEIILLFKQLDTNNDGLIDANDLKLLLPAKDTTNFHAQQSGRNLSYR